MDGTSHRQPVSTDDTFGAPLTLRRSIPTLKDLRLAGRVLRRRFPLEDIARWQPSAHRLDPIDLIAATNASRIPELVETRIEKMSRSPFAFFRGSAEVMLADLETLPTSGICHPICGDAHLGNFGPYELSDERTVFDLNDFDQAGLGPWEWDVARLCTSVILAARAGKGAGKNEQAIAARTARTYRRVLAQTVAKPVVDRIDGAVFDTPESAEAINLSWDAVRKALDRSKRTTAGGPASDVNMRGKQQARFDYSAELEEVKGAQAREVYEALDAYLPSLPPGRSGLFAKYEAVDVARGQAGIGSLGVLDYRVLLQGSNAADLVELQIKQARPTTQSSFLKLVDDQPGRSIVLCQRALQAFIDPLLGWTTIDNQPFYVRKRRAQPGGFDPKTVSTDRLVAQGVLCGAALAYAHARCGNPELVSAYLGSSDGLDEAMALVGSAYADQVERDHARFHHLHA